MSFSRSSPESSEMDGVTEGEEKGIQEAEGESELPDETMQRRPDGGAQAAGREGSGQRWAGWFGKKKTLQEKKKKKQRRERWWVAYGPWREKKKIKNRKQMGSEGPEVSKSGDDGNRPKDKVSRGKASGGQPVKSSSASDGEVTTETRPQLFDESGVKLSFGSSKSNPGRYNFRKGFDHNSCVSE